MTNKTPLNALHRDTGARMVEFGGWEMPIHYGSQIEEHHAVRRDAGMFDVSHMTIVDLDGERCEAFLRRLLANDVARLDEPGRALYTCMLNEHGGIIDDLIVYRGNESWYRMVVNAATRQKDLEWISAHAAHFEVTVREREDLAMVAVQGPTARDRVAQLLSSDDAARALSLERFHAARCADLYLARTGYTGEDGFEILVPARSVPEFWQELAAVGVRPCGLGARDTLRLEAGMNLYGQDMDESTTPLESGLAWTVAFDPADRAFVGREALEAQRAAGVARRLVGLLLLDAGVLRRGQRVNGDGVVTSGTYSPTLERSIAFARVAADTPAEVIVDIRGRDARARVVKPPFARNGKAVIDLPAAGP